MQRARAFGRRAQSNNGKNMIKIRLKTRHDNQRISTYLKNNWGSEFIISKGKKYYCDDVQGLIAEGDYSISGICLFAVKNEELEIVMIESFVEKSGVGSQLMKELESIAKEQELKRIWLVTTNDNINALRFYFKNGFTFVNIARDVIAEYRKIKPEIPLLNGENGIPIMDEIELEKII
jgi:N-acetylglutamate synthase-like GNAT family acetyltransferase